MQCNTNKLIQIALNTGFTKAVFIKNLFLECKPELRAYCNAKDCPNHGQNWVCPPGCGTLEECEKKIRDFAQGLLVQSITSLTPPTELNTYKDLGTAHNLRFLRLIEAVRHDCRQFLPLTTGGCVLCKSCSYPEPCRKPDLKMESLSAFGIDVFALCQKAGLEYSFREDTLYLTALLLIK